MSPSNREVRDCVLIVVLPPILSNFSAVLKWTLPYSLVDTTYFGESSVAASSSWNSEVAGDSSNSSSSLSLSS